MTTVWPGNEHVKSMPGEGVIDICWVTSCVTIQPGEEMLSLYSRVKSCRMENLKFEPKHNLVACLDESIPETEGYRDMMRFIKRTKYVYAMCAKPVIYARLIKSFWRTAEVITNEDGVIVVRGNITKNLQLTVSEQAIRTALRIDEDEVGANDELTVTECQECFVNMGHPPVFPKSQFVRARLGKKWKLLCYVIQQCMSRRSAGFDNFPSDIASPIVAIAENKPFNMSKWIMNEFVFNLGMYQVLICIQSGKGKEVQVSHISNGEIVNPLDLVDKEIDEDESESGNDDDKEDSEDRNDDDKEDSEDDDDDDDDDGDDDSGDDGNSDDSAESVHEEAENVEVAEPVEFEIENVEVVEPVVVEEPVEVVSVTEEFDIEAPRKITVQYVRSRRSKAMIEPMLVEELNVIEDVNMPEQMVDIVQIAKQVEAEAEFVAQTDDETDAGISVYVPVDIPTTSSLVAENIEQSLESSPKIASSVSVNEDKKKIAELEELVAKLLDANEQLKASNERKKKRLEEFWATHNQNLETFRALDADYVKLKADYGMLKDEHDKLKDEHDNWKFDYKELKAECNTLDAEKEMLEKWLEETRSKKSGSTSDKDFSDEVMEVTEPTQEAKVYYTRARGTKNVGIRVESPITIPDEAAETVNPDKAEGKRKLDAVPEINGEEGCTKKARMEESQIEPIQSMTETEVAEMAKVDETVIEAETDKTVQIEPIQSESVVETEVPEVIEVVENAPETAEPETNPDDEIPADLSERFAYLEKMKYNPVYLNGLTVSQINEEYEKCLTAQDKAAADEKDFVVEMGEWTPLQESLNIDDLPPQELYHQNPEEMSSRNMREWLSSRNYPYKTLKKLKHGSLKKIVESFMKTEKMYNRMFYLDYNNPQYYELTKRYNVLGPKEIPVMALPENAHKKRQELIDMFPSEVKSYNIPMDVRESWHKSATAGDIVRSLLSKGQSVAELLDSMIVPEKSKKVKIIAWKYDEVFDAFMIKRVNGLCDVYHYYSSIFKLEVQDLKELHKLRLVNHTHAERGDKCAMLLDAGISRLPKYLEFRGQQEDSAYVQSKKSRKQKKLVVSDDMYLEEFSDEYFDKDMITLFSTFELKLLHPSYIDHLRSYKMEKCKDKVAEADRKLFMVMVEVIATASEKIRVRKALLNANLVKVDIPEIEFMRVTAKGTLEVQVKGRELPYEFYTNIDFAGLTLDSLRRMNACDILTNESKPRQAKIAEKFKSCIEEALKEQEEYKGKELLDVKEEPGDW
ncbi:hypothetical protein QVD17_16731 [Tagetes erecta]|uniref:Uncharacterized protein n=1 Tax=Tagetes erecta TaxID=13708 RepID=A0AAD8KUQ4_TARER|nr:hypothetical protein QVD17_16731 [Tagetes erecta]